MAMSNAERQALWREKRKQELDTLRNATMQAAPTPETRLQDDQPLSMTAQQKVDRAIAKEKKRLQKMYEAELYDFDRQVREAAKTLMPDMVETYRIRIEEANNERMKYMAMTKGIKAQLGQDDYKFLLNVLHPDRAPEDRKDKFNKAFDIVRKLDSYIKTSTVSAPV